MRNLKFNPEEIPNTQDEVSERWIEGQKLGFELAKHLTTLNTGCLLILATFLEKLAPHRFFGTMLWICIPSFFLSLLFSLAVMGWIHAFFLPRKNMKTKSILIHDVAGGLCILTFILGVGAMSVFAFGNLALTPTQAEKVKQAIAHFLP